MVTSNPTVFTPISDRRLAGIAVIPSVISALAGQPVFQERLLVPISAQAQGIKTSSEAKTRGARLKRRAWWWTQ